MPRLPLTFDNLEIGNIVEFATKQFQVGLSETKITKGNMTTVHKEGQNKMFPPSMVVLEIVQEDSKKAHLHDEQTGEKKKDPIKVNCQWYSDRTGKFNTRWFNIGVLRRIDKQPKDIAESVLKLNVLVSLKTFETANRMTTKILSNAIKKPSGDVKYTITEKYDTLSFLPPMMYVIGILPIKESEKKPLYHKSGKGKQIRKMSSTKIKCMWYDHVSGKFSEAEFSSESLIIPKALTHREKFGS